MLRINKQVIISVNQAGHTSPVYFPRKIKKIPQAQSFENSITKVEVTKILPVSFTDLSLFNVSLNYFESLSKNQKNISNLRIINERTFNGKETGNF